MRSLFVLALLAPSVALADGMGQVTVALSPQGMAAATAAGETPQQLSDQIQTQINNEYQANNVNQFLREFTDATGFSNRGLGVDYVSAPHSFMIGFAGAASVASSDVLTGTQHPTGGLAANFGVMIGTNLRGWGLPRWTLFGNGWYESGSTDKLTGHLTSGGAHLQYRLVKPEEDGGSAIVLRWIGIDVTSGIEYTRWTLGIDDSISNNFTLSGGNLNETVTLNSTGKFNLTSQTLTVPIEISTGFRIVELVSVYVGGGVDLTVGKTTVDGDLNGTLTTSDGTNLGTAHITETGSNTGSPAALRALAGVQLNLWKLKVFVQGNVSQIPAASVSFGLRLVM
jgi:opacity protein-like surface antigen